MYLPSVLPGVQPPEPSGYTLAIDSQATSDSYHLGIFWRLKGSTTSAYDDSEYVGNIDFSTTGHTTIKIGIRLQQPTCNRHFVQRT